MLVRKDLPVLPAFRDFMMRPLREIAAWDPFREMEFIDAEPELRLQFTPHFDVKETKDAYVFKTDVPGVAEKDLDLSLSGNRLTISGKREQEKKEQGDVYYTWERTYGAFTRTFTLPEGIDPEHVEADLKNGVLTIVAAKKAELKPHRISIKGLIEKVRGKEEAKV